jgi:hypothetical protein
MKACRVKTGRLIAACLMAFAIQTATADPPRDGPERPTAKLAKQPVGTPHASSSFAPHARQKRRVYGDPIQRPIVTYVKPKKPVKPH